MITIWKRRAFIDIGMLNYNGESFRVEDPNGKIADIGDEILRFKDMKGTFALFASAFGAIGLVEGVRHAIRWLTVERRVSHSWPAADEPAFIVRETPSQSLAGQQISHQHDLPRRLTTTPSPNPRWTQPIISREISDSRSSLVRLSRTLGRENSARRQTVACIEEDSIRRQTVGYIKALRTNPRSFSFHGSVNTGYERCPSKICHSKFRRSTFGPQKPDYWDMNQQPALFNEGRVAFEWRLATRRVSNRRRLRETLFAA